MEIQNKNIALIILAAGESKRMGQAKQMLQWKNTTLLGHCIEQAQNSLINHIYVVLGAQYTKIFNAHKHYKVNFINNRNWKEDLGQSIAFGVQHISSKNYDGVLLLLADQPQIKTDYINRMLEHLNLNTPILATSYTKSIGVPVIFTKPYFETLIQNTNAKGAKSILMNNKASIKLLKTNNDIEDIDTYNDYVSLYSRFHSTINR